VAASAILKSLWSASLDLATVRTVQLLRPLCESALTAMNAHSKFQLMSCLYCTDSVYLLLPLA